MMIQRQLPDPWTKTVICFRRRSGSFDSREYEHAIARGAKYTVKLEVAECQQMHHITAPHPEGLGAKM
jgi:hypothetical protein